jgi:hypothetical protein
MVLVTTLGQAMSWFQVLVMIFSCHHARSFHFHSHSHSTTLQSSRRTTCRPTPSFLDATNRNEQEPHHYDNIHTDKIPSELHSQVQRVAITLWGDRTKLKSVLPTSVDFDSDPSVSPTLCSGEMAFDADSLDLDYWLRLEYFQQAAYDGDPSAQHSLGLLLWNGFAGVQDEIASAQWHAAAACQGHLDAMAVLGGCLRTGTGVQENEDLGIQFIEWCARQGNPTGINKQAALLESEDDDYNGALRLYQSCLENENENVTALVLLNLGYSLVNGPGDVSKDVELGEFYWEQAAAMAPDEGSEEAAYFLSQQYDRTDYAESKRWLQLSADLGFPEAVDLLWEQNKEEEEW